MCTFTREVYAFKCEGVLWKELGLKYLLAITLKLKAEDFAKKREKLAAMLIKMPEPISACCSPKKGADSQSCEMNW